MQYFTTNFTFMLITIDNAPVK